ncbi:MAG TPA: OmpA family protein [Polyangiaceae bacterium]
MKPASLVYSASFVLLFVACGGAEKKPVETPTAPTAPAVAAAPAPAKQSDVDNDPTRGNLNIEDAIRKACGITDAEAYFAYDSANVKPEYRAVLKKLAVCFTTGPLAGKVMRLVGHADPRGEESYNLALGGQRADNVKRIIVAEGMTAAKTETSSRGEMDATGNDESGWAKDRRVDVMLGN